jgi:iron complex outermembrane receptor protein
MISRFLLNLLWLLALGTTLNGQAVIKGKVFDLETREPLIAANVLYGNNQGTVTSTDGRYLITTQIGKISLSFRYVGYQSLTKIVYLEPEDTLVLDIGLKMEASAIDPVVVSAGKAEQRLSELTVSLNVIRPDFLSGSHITDPVELVNKTPGIEVLDGQASIRGGSGFSYGAGSRVLALIDGLPVLSADAGNIKWQFLPLENISQVEIIKGASSVLYGSSALNGVINFRLARPGPEPETKFFLETGLFDKPKNKDWIWWDSPRVFTSTSFSHMRKAGNTDIGTGIYLQSDAGYRKYNEEKLGRANLHLKHHNARIGGLSYGMNINAGITQKTDFVLWENASTGALIQDTSTANQLTGHLVTIDPFIQFSKNNSWRHELKTRFQSSENRFPDASQNDSRALSFLADYQSRFHPFEWLSLNAGLFENYSKIFSEFYGDHYALNLAAYTQADITPVEKLKLVAGFRIEFNSLDGETDRLVPLFRAGANYRISDYTFLRGSFGQGYRYPSIAEKFASTTLGAVRIVPNPDILPESGWSSEIGIKQGIAINKVRGFADLAFFYTRNTDMIEYLFGIYPTPDGSSFSYGFKSTNVENSKVYGAELSFLLNIENPSLDHSISGGYTYMYPIEVNPRSDNREIIYLKYRRKHSMKINYTGNYQSFRFGMDLKLASKILRIDDVFLNELTRETILPGFYDYWNSSNKGYIVIDPNIGVNLFGNYQISLAVKNVLNTEYMGRPGDILPHRHFSMRFSGRF